MRHKLVIAATTVICAMVVGPAPADIDCKPMLSALASSSSTLYTNNDLPLRQKAWHVWQAKVISRYGVNYANRFKARDISSRCHKNGPTTYCRVYARPCRIGLL